MGLRQTDLLLDTLVVFVFVVGDQTDKQTDWLSHWPVLMLVVKNRHTNRVTDALVSACINGWGTHRHTDWLTDCNTGHCFYKWLRHRQTKTKQKQTTKRKKERKKLNGTLTSACISGWGTDIHRQKPVSVSIYGLTHWRTERAAETYERTYTCGIGNYV